jgi:peptidoglycan/LPS O-acetylase OafA/YrhL
MNRIKGLDQIRFICALIVMVGHFGLPLPTPGAGNGGGMYKIIVTSVDLIFNGPAAVVIFFIISGFCINFPFQKSQRVDLAKYYTRRLIRIGIPAIIAVIIYKLLHADLTPPAFGVLWSIICEVIYYLLYPILFYLRKYIQWAYLVFGAYLISLILLLFNLAAVKEAQQSYTALGYLTWVVGLPCWLMGCWLSENFTKFKPLSPKNMWLIRVLMIAIMALLRVAKFHWHSLAASNCFTLNIFAFIAVIWLGFEIVYYQNRQPSKILESCGKWSYSLYLMHPLSPELLLAIGLTGVYDKLLCLISLLLAYVFYLLIEKPSHNLSIFISSNIRKAP